VRTLSETQQYAYSLSEKGLYVNLYGDNTLNTKLMDGGLMQLIQSSDYPWDGNVHLELVQAPKNECSIFLRIPGWCTTASLKVNGKSVLIDSRPGTYLEVRKTFSKGDVVELDLPMPVRLVESNPLVEETRNQIAVMRGPIVYCLESTDLPQGVRLQDVLIPLNASLNPVKDTENGLSLTFFDRIEGSPVLMLEGKALAQKRADWSHELYREVSTETISIPIRLVPYYAWGNRGRSEMSVWLPVAR
jgi:uncharacterized protein